MGLHWTTVQQQFLSPEVLPFYYWELPNLAACQGDDSGSEMFLRGVERILRHMSALPPLGFNSLPCELTEAFCPSQGTVWAKQRPGSVCTTMITGVRRGPTRAASSAARGRRTSGCTVTPPGSTPQGPSSWWRKAAGWTTSTAMTGRVTERGRRSPCSYICYFRSMAWPWVAGSGYNINICPRALMESNTSLSVWPGASRGTDIKATGKHWMIYWSVDRKLERTTATWIIYQPKYQVISWFQPLEMWGCAVSLLFFF